MLLKKLQLKTIDYKFGLTICFLLFFNSFISAQEIIPDVVAEKPVEAPSSGQRQKSMVLLQLLEIILF